MILGGKEAAQNLMYNKKIGEEKYVLALSSVMMGLYPNLRIFKNMNVLHLKTFSLKQVFAYRS